MNKALILCLFLCLPLAQAWSEEVYRLYIGDVAPACNLSIGSDVTTDSSIKVTLFEVCTKEKLIEYAAVKDCFGRVNAAYQQLCLQEVDSTCDERLNARIVEWWDDNWTFKDCGVLLSNTDFSGMKDEFVREIALEDAFVDFQAKTFYSKAVDVQQEPEYQEYVPDEGTGGFSNANTPPPTTDLALQKPLEFLYLSWFYGIPVFFIWSGVLLMLCLILWHSKFVGESPAAETHIDHESRQYIRGTWTNIMKAQINLGVRNWMLLNISVLAICLILPLIGLAQWAVIASAGCCIVGLLIPKALF